MDRVPSGSYLAIWDSTHPTTSPAKENAQRAEDAYASTGAVRYSLRSPEEISTLLDGLEWVELGLVSVSQWRPAHTDGVTTLNNNPPPPVDAFGGVARRA